jgi:hypothetical protein
MGIPKNTETKWKNKPVGDHWKQQSQLSFSVVSDFKGNEVLKVTVVVQDESHGNRFWSKHVLRKGEDPRDLLAWRDPLKSEKYEHASMGFSEYGDKIEQGVSGSTVVREDRVNIKDIYYRFAYALIKALRDKKFGNDPQNVICPNRVEVIVDFKEAQSVEQYTYPEVQGTNQKNHKAEPLRSRGKHMKVVATQKSKLNDQKIKFEIDHCEPL